MTSVVDLLLETARADTALLIKNDRLGDDFSIPRNVDFLLIASDEAKANTVRDFINDNRYGVASVQPSNQTFRISVVINVAPQQHVICSMSGLFACISKLFSINYDGWGCELQ